ncbi:AbrB family transcriptional regulator [Salinarchaeum sp. Harcht-Bsk1]|uniref:AbrB/MazE/SpoVT family DNA-binding domain-containing protein n=1 Tax=Salinarchaeum sp. Harcht-Bsk1 TaxID=1333523 RepID=UPI0003423B64|nr:AbrB/MazE/SpoVT family DNA-binding domain-containing protein [Salinarchaeum sp. Harcht-Bsk1]AGN02893.1 AbrB family transcriptional regulator [Salinarchaeum sp. Harcht-Bsk1]
MGRDTRIVGERGQITIPKDLREQFGIRGGDEVVVRAEEDKIVIAQRTVDDRLAEGYREWNDRDRTVARTTSADATDRDDPDDVPEW